MPPQWMEFEELIVRIVRRVCAQNGHSVADDGASRAVAMRLAALIGERGLPVPLAVGERGAPGSMSEEECGPLVARIVGADGLSDALLVDVARQLVKACFYPEFTECRDSYRESARDGSCRRQELARVRKRVSGTHCVDCPHWVALAPAEHRAMVEREWKVGADAFAAHREVFLPEDFRALRRWLHAAARNRI